MKRIAIVLSLVAFPSFAADDITGRLHEDRLGGDIDCPVADDEGWRDNGRAEARQRQIRVDGPDGIHLERDCEAVGIKVQDAARLPIRSTSSGFRGARCAKKRQE
jgi:hypothetical protein